MSGGLWGRRRCCSRESGTDSGSSSIACSREVRADLRKYKVLCSDFLANTRGSK